MSGRRVIDDDATARVDRRRVKMVVMVVDVGGDDESGFRGGDGSVGDGGFGRTKGRRSGSGKRFRGAGISCPLPTLLVALFLTVLAVILRRKGER